MKECYSLNKDNTYITFFLPLHDNIFFHVSDAYVTGSFTGWKRKEDFLLQKAGPARWEVTLATDRVLVPANSGYPEFNFVVSRKILGLFKKTRNIKATPKDLGSKFLDNFIIAPFGGFTKEEQDELIDNDLKTEAVPLLRSFDLTKEEDIHRISNVRQVPGTVSLWRGYHPYKKSRWYLDTEDARTKIVNELIEKNGIKSIITLCGDEKIDESHREYITPYVQEIQKANNQCFIDTSYEVVYFDPKSTEYAKTVSTICSFIASHPAPYYIHCRLGSDRTGTMSAILACIAGATWEEIAADFEKTSEAGIHEFRSRKLLAQMFTRLLSIKDIDEVKDNLAVTVQDYLVLSGTISRELLEKVQQKLKNP